ncbi:hypothetical protein OA264_01280 [Alphaproteobacteria bacterium]|nr:hypothetical protein [Alphaproteobacteria bacterium]
MSNNKNFYKNLQILRKNVKERRKQELLDMINESSNSIEDKVALIKMSLTEFDGKELSDSFKSIINNDKKLKRNKVPEK